MPNLSFFYRWIQEPRYYTPLFYTLRELIRLYFDKKSNGEALPGLWINICTGLICAEVHKL